MERTLTRRRFIGLSAVAVALTLAPGLAAASPDLTVYFPKTGHHLSDDFLTFWRTHRNGALLGDPITEAIRFPQGVTVQYFENALLEQYEASDKGIQVANLGEQLTPKSRIITKGNVEINPEFYRKHGGVEFFGEPIAPTLFGKDSKTQNMRRFALRQHAFIPVYPPLKEAYDNYLDNRSQFPKLLWPGEIEALPLGRIAAQARGFYTGPVEAKPNALVYSSNLWDGQKRIVITLSNQTLTALEGDLPIMETIVSTGGDLEEGTNRFDTPTGRFRVLSKTDVLRYRSPFPEWRNYDVPGIGFNLNFTDESHYIHGTYWHDNFGIKRSAGCVNLNSDDASLVYNWARIGTPVTIVG